MMNEGDYRRRWLLLVKLAVSLFFLWLVLQKINLAVLRDHLKGADPLQLVYAAATLVAGVFAGAAAWLAVLRANRYAVLYRGVAAMHWCGMFFNSFLPSNIGGDFYKGYLLVKGSGGGAERAAVTLVLDRLINLSMLVLIGILSFCLSFEYYMAAALAAAGFVLVVVLLGFSAGRCRDGGGSRVMVFLITLLSFFRDRRCCAAAFAAALLTQGLKIGCHIFLIRALGLDLAVNSVWYVIPVFGVVSAVPVSLSGIGIREYVALAIAAPLAIVPEDLVALSLVSHLLYVTVNCLGLIPLVLTSRSRCVIR